MSDEMRPGLQPDAVAWLAQGPDRAPSGLLTRSLEQARGTHQRPALVAIALGAPTVAPRSGAITPVRVWLVAALLAAALVGVGLIASLADRSQLVVVTSPQPSRQSQDPSAPVPPAITSVYEAGNSVTVDQSSLNPWFEVKPARPEDIVFAGHRWEFAYGSCATTACTPQHSIDLTLGTVDEGVIYGSRPCPPEVSAGGGLPGSMACSIWEAEHRGPDIMAIKGTTTEELVAGWVAQFGDGERSRIYLNGVVWTTIEYESRIVGLVVASGTAAAATLNSYGDMPPGGIEGDLLRFLGSVHFPQPPSVEGAPITARLGDIEINMPGGWTSTTGRSTVTLFDGIGVFAFAITERVRLLRPGEEMVIERVQAQAGASFRVTGGTLGEVIAAIDAGLPGVTGEDISVDGVRAHRWHVPQLSISGPLTGVIVLEWKGAFYVITEHFPLDAASAGHLDEVLAGLNLL